MELKAFKGMPHEFGGIDYTEGSEVEGGEFAVQIGKSGNEYIFDKNSSEGERLSKEYKRLDKNGRLTEDDPLALEAFDQMAREEALKHAQRSVNEKGVDPFRNMYDQGGQAANGGVKYAAGGAKDMYFFGGMMGGMGSMMGGPNMMGLADMMGGADGILAMSNPNYSNPNNPNNPNNFGEDVGEVYPEGMFKGVSGSSLNASAPAPLPPLASAPQQRLATDPMTSMPTMDSYQLPTEPTPQMPTVATDDTARTDHLLAQSNLKQEQAANAPQETKEGSGMISGIGRGLEGLIKSTNNAGAVEQQASYRSSPDDLTLSKGTKYVQPNQADYAGSAIGGFASGFETGNQMGGPVAGAVMGVIQGVTEPLMEKKRAKEQQDAADREFKNNLAFSRIDELNTQQQNNIAQDINSGKGATDYHPGLFSKQGGALPKNKGVYGYYANGGGKKNIYRPGGVTDPTNPKKKGTVLEVNPENVTADGSQVLEYPYLLPEAVARPKEKSYAQILADAEEAQKANAASGNLSQAEKEDFARSILYSNNRSPEDKMQEYRDDPTNPLAYMPDADFSSIGYHLNKGNYGDAALYTAFAALPGAAGPVVNKVKPYITKATNYFPEINLGRWGKFNESIPDNKILREEYADIEQMTKANNTWMKNPDGSAFKGTPEQFVQQQSENFKRAFPPEYFERMLHGSKSGDLQTLDLSKNRYGQQAYGEGLYMTDSPNEGKWYAGLSDDIKPNYRSPDGKVYELGVNTEGAQKFSLDSYEDKNFLNKFNRSYLPTVEHYFGRPRKDIPLEEMKRIEAIQGFADNIPDNMKDLSKNIILESGYQNDRGASKWILGKSGVKSLEGNSGMFDMTNPNIYYKDGGVRDKEELLIGPTGPQGVIGAEGVVGPSTGYPTSNQVSSEDFASDSGMIPVRRDNTCVKGMNCFEDIAGMDVIPNWIANNRDLEKFLNSPEGKEAYEQVSAIDAKAGDMVQFTRPVDVTNPKTGVKEAASYALNYGGNPLNYPYHVGLMNSDSTYIGDGDKELPLHEKSIYMDDDKRFDFESAGIFGDAAKFFMTDDNKKKANYYRLKDKEARQKQLDAAIKAKKDGVDISRQLYKNETPTGYVGNPYYNSRGSYPSAF